MGNTLIEQAASIGLLATAELETPDAIAIYADGCPGCGAVQDCREDCSLYGE